MNGVLFVRTDSALRAVSTDGHRLGCFSTNADGRAACDVLVRLADARMLLSTVKNALRTVGKRSHGLVKVVLCAPRELPKEGPGRLVSTVLVSDAPFAALESWLVDERFPPYEQVIPSYARSTEWLGDGAAIQAISVDYLCAAAKACQGFGEVQLVHGPSWKDPLVVRADKGANAIVIVMPLVISEQYRAEEAAKAADPREPCPVVPLHG